MTKAPPSSAPTSAWPWNRCCCRFSRITGGGRAAGSGFRRLARQAAVCPCWGSPELAGAFQPGSGGSPGGQVPHVRECRVWRPGKLFYGASWKRPAILPGYRVLAQPGCPPFACAASFHGDPGAQDARWKPPAGASAPVQQNSINVPLQVNAPRRPQRKPPMSDPAGAVPGSMSRPKVMSAGVCS